MKAKLIVVQGKPEGREIRLPQGRFLVGRGKECHLRPASEMVSRQHCQLTVTADAVLARDMGSTNGTLVNGVKIKEETRLREGDLLEIGPLAFALVLEEEAPVAAAAAAPKSAEPVEKPEPAPAAAPTVSAVEPVNAEELVTEWLFAEDQTEEGAASVASSDTTMVLPAVKDASSEEDKPDKDKDKDKDKAAKPADKKSPAATPKKADEDTTSTAARARELMRKYLNRGR